MYQGIYKFRVAGLGIHVCFTEYTDSQGFTSVPPHGLADRPDIPFHAAAGGAKLEGDFHIKPLADIRQDIGRFHGKLHAVNEIVKALVGVVQS